MNEFHGLHPSEERLFEMVHGLATPDAAGDLLDHLRRCPPCEAQFVAICRARERALAEPTPSFGAEVVAAAAPSGSVRAAALLAGALAAMLLLGLGLPRLVERASTPGDHWLSTELEIHRMRSRPGLVPAGLEHALELYESRQLGPAIEALSRLDLEAEWDDLRDVYLAGALVGAERFPEAGQVLEGLDIPTLPYEFRQAARWYRYRWLSHTGLEGEARRQLEVLRDDPGPVGALARRAVAENA